MSDNKFNDQLVLISGESGSGKSMSLRNIRDQPNWMYLNTEAGKRLPFKNKFDSYIISDPYQVFEGFDYAIGNPEVKGIILDSFTFLMDMFETQYVLPMANTMQGWSNYAQFAKTLFQQKVVLFGRPVIIIAHTLDVYDEQEQGFKTSVPIKGSLKNNGIEAYFSTVVSPKKVSIKDLEKMKSNLLTITEDEKELEYKHVFQTRLTKKTRGERIRSPMGLFGKEETYIDNDSQLLLDRLTEFYK